MERIFRLLILAALMASVVLAVMPFDRTLTITVPLHGSAALLDAGASLLLLVGTVSGLISAAGMLAFRAWARSLARLTTLVLLVGVILSARVLPWVQLLPRESIAVAVLALGCWFGALTLAYTSPVKARFVLAR